MLCPPYNRLLPIKALQKSWFHILLYPYLFLLLYIHSNCSSTNIYLKQNSWSYVREWGGNVFTHEAALDSPLILSPQLWCLPLGIGLWKCGTWLIARQWVPWKGIRGMWTWLQCRQTGHCTRALGKIEWLYCGIWLKGRSYISGCWGITHGLCFSPNRYCLCVATEQSVKICDLDSKTLVYELEPNVTTRKNLIYLLVIKLLLCYYFHDLGLIVYNLITYVMFISCHECCYICELFNLK